MTSVEKELTDLSKISRKEGQSERLYLESLVDKVDSLCGENRKVWDMLSKESQKWMNDAVSSWESGRDFPKFPGKDVPAVSTPAPSPTPVTNSSSSPKPDKGQKGFVTTRIRELSCSYPEWTVGDIEKALKEEGFSPTRNTISVMYYECKKIIKVLEGLGKLK